MRISIALTAASLALAGCAAPTTGPTPAGYADGTKTVTTGDLVFTATSKGMSVNAFGSEAPANVTISYRTTSDPNIIIAKVSGQEIQLNWIPTVSQWLGSNSAFKVTATLLQTSTDQQVTLGLGSIQDLSTFGSKQIGFYTAGLETDPASITATTRGGSATYTGNTNIMLFHSDPAASIQGNGFGSGTGTLNANFATGAVAGSMSFTEGMNISGLLISSDPGYGLSPTTPAIITINPTTISGNGFNSTLAITPANLSMSSVTSSSIAGTFYGVNASNVGATFNGSGVSWDGTTPVTFIGGFIGQ